MPVEGLVVGADNKNSLAVLDVGRQGSGQLIRRGYGGADKFVVQEEVYLFDSQRRGDVGLNKEGGVGDSLVGNRGEDLDFGEIGRRVELIGLVGHILVGDG